MNEPYIAAGDDEPDYDLLNNAELGLTAGTSELAKSHKEIRTVQGSGLNSTYRILFEIYSHINKR